MKNEKKYIGELGYPLDEGHQNCSGIYCLVNRHNGHKYVGQTHNFIKRKRQHMGDLKNNRHTNQYLQNVYNKYSRPFYFIVLEYCEPDVLDDKEQYWINRLHPEYNLVKDIYKAKEKYDGHVRHPLLDEDDYKPMGYYSNPKNRPDWHYWVYGGGKNPLLSRRTRVSVSVTDCDINREET